jgi:hypothetical protein
MPGGRTVGYGVAAMPSKRYKANSFWRLHMASSRPIHPIRLATSIAHLLALDATRIDKEAVNVVNVVAACRFAATPRNVADQIVLPPERNFAQWQKPTIPLMAVTSEKVRK